MLDLNSNFLFFFSGLGAFNGIVLSACLFFCSERSLANRMLAAILLMICLRVGKSVMFFFDPALAKNFLQLGLSACFMIGPFLYFYCGTVSKHLGSLRVDWRWQVSGLAIFIGLFGLIYPYESNPVLWGDYIYKAVNWIWLFYIAMAAKWILPLVKGGLNSVRNLSHELFLMLNVYLGVAIIWLAYFTASYTSYIVGALSFSFILYLSLLLFIRHRGRVTGQKYLDKKIDASTASEVFGNLQAVMVKENLYCDPNLSLSTLAKRLSISATQLSQLLNDNWQTSFSKLINEYRIERAKSLLLSEPNLNMENIADLCGYNSMSTFYSAFKKVEHCPPAKYRQLNS